jgi:hypothetical protein
MLAYLYANTLIMIKMQEKKKKRKKKKKMMMIKRKKRKCDTAKRQEN